MEAGAGSEYATIDVETDLLIVRTDRQ